MQQLPRNINDHPPLLARAGEKETSGVGTSLGRGNNDLDLWTRIIHSVPEAGAQQPPRNINDSSPIQRCLERVGLSPQGIYLVNGNHGDEKWQCWNR